MLVLVPTPLGNLQDISFRCLDALQHCECIFAEDTRVAKHLLMALAQQFELDFKPEKRFFALHSHNEEQLLSQEQTLATLQQHYCVYTCDAGMPSISDPGAALVRFCQFNDIQYQALPGASAATLSFALSGFEAKSFYFYGFLSPKQAKRQRELAQVIQERQPVILYESPKRILQLTLELEQLKPDLEVFFAKELSKMHQQYFFGTVTEVKSQLQNANLKGEWSVVVNSKNQVDYKNIALDLLEDFKNLPVAKKQSAKLLAKLTGESVGHCYKMLLNS